MNSYARRFEANIRKAAADHTATLRNVNRTEEADRLRGRAKRMAEKAAFSVKYTSRNPAGDAGLAGFYFAEAMALYDRAETLRA